jgi:hypothetical protein
MMSFYDAKTPTARKPHICEMCGEIIKKGEVYSKESGKWCGELFTRKMHLQCFDVMNEYCDEVDNEFVWEDIAEYWREKYCRKCVNFYPECNPDERCNPNDCPDKKGNRCTATDPCDIMDRISWCTKYMQQDNKCSPATAATDSEGNGK